MHTLRIHLLESKYEFLKLLRQPAYALPTVLFPILFYAFFGIGFGSRSAGNVQMTTYLIATYGAFGVMGAALFGFGVSVAIERGQGWLEVKRTTPMPISAYFVAKIAMAMLFGAIIVALLFATGILFGNVVLTIGQIAALFGILVSGSIVFCALGLAIGCLVSPNSAAPIVNLIYLPLAFLSGLWIPVWMLPKPIQALAQWLPPYHFSQLALKVVGADRGQSSLYHVAALLLSTAVFTAIAYFGFRRGDTA
jgi:ABC-2 type transport system permease protein